MGTRLRLKADINTILRIYYENPELGTAEIKELFGNIAPSTITKLRNDARAETARQEKKILTFGSYTVNTEMAFKAWHIDVEDLERRRQKLQKLNLLEVQR